MGWFMLVSLARLVVTGGCPLQRAALGEWLRAQGFHVASETLPAPGEAPPVVLHLCSEHQTSDELAAIATRYGDARTVAILTCTCDRSLAMARSSGLRNVFCADETPERLAAALRTVLAGFDYVSPSLERFRTPDEASKQTAAPACRSLTPRELDVLRFLAQGFSKKRIAETLHLSVKTVDNHSTSIMSKLNIHNRVDLARYAIREGLATA